MAGSVITAGTTRTQAGATLITADVTTVNTSTAPAAGSLLGDGVQLPQVGSGQDRVFLINNTNNPIQVYGFGTDTINGVAGNVGIAMAPNSADVYIEASPGAWSVDAGFGSSGQLQTMLSLSGISAAGTTQATATPLVAMINNVTTVAAGAGVNLPSSTNAAGLEVVVVNSGLNPLTAYPAQGASDTINGQAAATGVQILPGTAAVFNCPVAGQWVVSPASTKAAAYNTNAATASATLTAANISGGVASVDLNLTGTLGGAGTATFPTAAALVAALHAPVVGTSYRLRVIKSSADANAWTLAAGAGWTFTGPTLTIASGAWLEGVVTVTAVGATPTATFQTVARGTYS